MINQLPPELFAQRPVRSEYQSSKGASTVSKRRVILVGGIAAILLGSIFVVDTILSNQEQDVAMIPHIASTDDIKERPEQPGGIDIPHRDVAVFDQLSERNDPQVSEVEEKVEQLLPQAEEPIIEEELVASGEAVVASMEKAVTESLEAELNKAAQTLPPAVTETVLDGTTESLIGAAPEALPSVAPVEEAAAKAKVETIPTKVVEPIKAKIKTAVKKAEKTMKVDAPKVVKKVAPKVKAVVSIKPKAVAAPKTPVRLPSDLFTKGETAVKKAVTGKTKRLQLGSFRSSDIARKASEVLAKKHRSQLRGATLKVVRADLGAKGIYYRVMSSSLPENTAKSACKAIAAAKSACMVTR